MNHDSLIKIADGHPLLSGEAADGRLRLFRRFSDTRRYLVPLEDLSVDDAELGTVASDLIAGGEADVVLFGAPGGDRRRAFVPDIPVTMTVTNTEVAASDFERLRRSLAATLDPERIAAARDAQKAQMQATSAPGGKNTRRLFSEGLKVYATSICVRRSRRRRRSSDQDICFADLPDIARHRTRAA